MNSCLFQLASLYFVFLTISGTLESDSNTCPAGVTHCFLDTPYYSKYQCGTCLTDACIRKSSKVKRLCRERTSTYCDYKSMVNKYVLYSGSDCPCDVHRRFPQPPVTLPATCYSPDGTDCGWYRRCLAKLYPCKGQAEYAINYGEKFCELYEKSKSEFSENALQWLDAARKCLQLALVPVLHFGQVKPTCEDVRTMAFNSHVPCYVAPYDGLSVCSLSLSDWANIVMTVKSSFVSSAWLETIKASLLTAGMCAGIY